MEFWAGCNECFGKTYGMSTSLISAVTSPDFLSFLSGDTMAVFMVVISGLCGIVV